MRRWTYLVFPAIFLALACTLSAPGATGTPGPTPILTATMDSNIDPVDPTAAETTVLVSYPFPQHIQYAPNTILPNHRSQAQLDDDVRRFYDYWKSTYLVDAGTSENGLTMYRVAFGKSAEARKTTVSEGQGYGMIIVPLMAGYDPDARAIFDGLWEFVRAHPSEIDPRLMDWNVPKPDGNDSAFDGDADIAFGLLLADAQWGSDGGVDYLDAAIQMIAGILESTIGPESRLPMLGDWVEASGEDIHQYTPRASDFMLVNFRAFGRASGDPAWEQVVQASQVVMLDIQSDFSPVSGLLPDFIVRNGQQFQPAPPDFLEGPNDGAYNYNAGRVPWRVGLDALLNHDGVSRGIVLKISSWIQSAAGNDPRNIYSGYDLSGTPLPGSDYFTTFFVAPMGVAAMNDPAQQDWLNAIYDAVYQSHEDYYEDSVNLLCLLIMSGNHWAP